MIRWSSHRASKQVADPLLQDATGGKPNRVLDPPGFQILVDVGIGEGGIGPEVDPRDRVAIGSSTAFQSSALWTLPGRSAQRSRTPNWLNTNTGR